MALRSNLQSKLTVDTMFLKWKQHLLYKEKNMLEILGGNNLIEQLKCPVL